MYQHPAICKKSHSQNIRVLNFYFLLFLLTIIISSSTFAQDKTNEIDKVFSWAKQNEPGCVCAVSQNGKVIFNRAYGTADLEREVPLSPNSVFDAGSVVKQFVAASVLLLVEDGKLSLTEDIHQYIPELPDYGHKITLDHLLTHTSGIRDWTGIRPLAEGDPEALTLALRQRGLNFVPGEEWSYSNSGYVLLKEIVARTSGMSFSEFTQKRLWQPLNMNSTTYLTDMSDVVKNRALAYKKEKEDWKLDVLLGNDRGGGGALMSTPADLLAWNDALTNNRLGSFVTEKLHEPATLNNGRKLSYTRGLNVDMRRDEKIVWHSGGAAGYSTLLARLPGQGLSVALMCNVDGGARSQYASRIFDLLLPEEKRRETTNIKDVNIAPENLASRAGLFFNDKTGLPLRMMINNKTLFIAGGGPLVALAQDRFTTRESSLQFLSGAEFELQFISADQLEIRTKDGATFRYYRAKNYKPAATELNAFAGRYESNEMGSVLEMVPEKGGLLMRFYRNPSKAVQLMPVDKDTFMVGMMTVRFLRDKDGKITGYNYSNPVVRNIKFSRINN